MTKDKMLYIFPSVVGLFYSFAKGSVNTNRYTPHKSVVSHI